MNLKKEIEELKRSLRRYRGQLYIIKDSLMAAIWLSKFNWKMIKNQKLREETKESVIIFLSDTGLFEKPDDTTGLEQIYTCEELLNQMATSTLAVDAYRRLYDALKVALTRDEFLSQYTEGN